MKRINAFSISAAGALVLTSLAFSQAQDFVPVVSKPISRMADLPGEFLPFLAVSLHAKVPGFVERILVDRGSRVDGGQLHAELSAPEMAARNCGYSSSVSVSPRRPAFSADPPGMTPITMTPRMPLRRSRRCAMPRSSALK